LGPLAILKSSEFFKLLLCVDALPQSDVVDFDGFDPDLVDRQHRRIMALLEHRVAAVPLAPHLVLQGGHVVAVYG
jgi:hypothetical protein